MGNVLLGMLIVMGVWFVVWFLRNVVYDELRDEFIKWLDRNYTTRDSLERELRYLKQDLRGYDYQIEANVHVLMEDLYERRRAQEAEAQAGVATE